jgi:thiol-disulfide isomerase/thioredoxin
MKQLFTFLSILILVYACNNAPENNIVLRIKNLENDSVLVVFIQQTNLNNEIVDTIVARNGKIAINFPVTELYEVVIVPFDLIYKYDNGKRSPLPSSRIRCYINKEEKISINGEILNKQIDYNATGNLLSEQLSIARKMKMPLFQERISFEMEYNRKNVHTENEEQEYWQKRNVNDIEYSKQSVLFIETHPECEYSARLLMEIKDKKKATELFNSLEESTKKSYFGIIMDDMIHGWSLTTPGIKFPNIVAKLLSGDEFSLKNYQGKYVALDFWGSWCTPCLSEIQSLKRLQAKYSDSLIIVGIACHDNLDKLLKTINEDQISWFQIMEGTERETKYSQLFGVKSFPTKILIDKEGLVLKTYVGMDESFYTDIEKLINKKQG